MNSLSVGLMHVVFSNSLYTLAQHPRKQCAFWDASWRSEASLQPFNRLVKGSNHWLLPECSPLWWKKAFSFPAPKHVPIFERTVMKLTVYYLWSLPWPSFCSQPLHSQSVRASPFSFSWQCSWWVCVGKLPGQLLAHVGMTYHPGCMHISSRTCLLTWGVQLRRLFLWS